MRRIAVFAAVLALTGCSVHVKEVRLQLPQVEQKKETKQVVIDQVTDARSFQDVPNGAGAALDDSAIRSLGPERLASTIGGGHQFAHVLADQKKVSEVVRGLVSSVFQEAGYQTVPAQNASSDAPHVSVRITQFWDSMPFNFGRALTWTQQLKVWIATDIVIKDSNGERSTTVTGTGANIIQVMSEENIRETYLIAMKDYQKELRSRIFQSL